MTARPILLVGEKPLHERSVEVTDVGDAQFVRDAADLKATLEQFRRENGFGRAIAAPQIGVSRRFIALHLNANGPFVIVNPRIVSQSTETFTLWDDCFSFPWLMVRVRRSAHVSVEFTDENGALQRWADLDLARSELLQHEIDHLDGVLSFDRIDREKPGISSAIISRTVYLQHRKHFDAQVDYSIAPT